MTPTVRYGALVALLAGTGVVVWFASGLSRSASVEAIPSYSVSARNDVPGLGVVGEVLIPSVTRTDTEREDLFRSIAETEGLTVAFFFSTTAAVEAHRAVTRNGAATASLSQGFLGRLTRDEYTPGEEIYP